MVNGMKNNKARGKCIVPILGPMCFQTPIQVHLDDLMTRNHIYTFT